MHARHARNRGFSLIEALTALIITIIVVACGYVYLGRKLVDDDDPVRAAKDAGYAEAKVLSRHDFSAPFSDCGSNHVAFHLEVAKDGQPSSTVTVCCPAWFGQCDIKE